MIIVENAREYLPEFIRLNEEWIEHYFELEDADKKIAADPYQVVDSGGYIFTLLNNRQVVGVCALFNDGNGIFELAKMAVAPRFQGRGYSNILMQHCLHKLKNIDAKSVYLVSNTALIPAINLYRKYYFEILSEGQHPLYSRGNIVMRRDNF